MSPQRVFFFGNGTADGSADMKQVLGGKGAGLAEMTRLGIPVPPGFTISAGVCAEFHRSGGHYPEGLQAEIDRALTRLEEVMGKRFGDPADPLLVSVRSGAAVSMPGMMDTVLNLGLHDAAVRGLATRTGNPRFAWDAFRRFINMFGDVVMGVPHEAFEEAMDEAKREVGASVDTDLDATALERLCHRYLDLYRRRTGADFPANPRVQLKHAIDAVFRSWMTPRAVTYRKIHGITGLPGTAVNVQSMVFGNMGETSGTGVCFTRDPAFGENRPYGDFLINAQGEDVVAGIRDTLPIEAMAEAFPHAYRDLMDVRSRLERRYRDMQDVEFTVQEGRLFLLQTRTGKRTGFAAVKIACNLVDEGLRDPAAALQTIEANNLEHLLFRVFRRADKDAAVRAGRVLTRGLPAGPGAASGRVVFHSEDAEARAARGERVILVRRMTSPEDIGGMHAAAAILTSTGGLTSHAAVVARGMGKTCVVGAGALAIDHADRSLHVGGRRLREGDEVSVDGMTGEVLTGALATEDSEVAQALIRGTLPPADSEWCGRFQRVMGWADENRRMGVRTNADTPDQASTARALGAEGIGLCRTEHMFFAPDRIVAVREMILARGASERRAAIEKLRPFQRDDFLGIFRVMAGLPVTVRLLDPPLHEFLPHDERSTEEVAQAMGVDARTVRERAEALHEFNPMLGHRGCRLGITYPEIYEMQVGAIPEAACDAADEGVVVHPEIMIPLVGTAKELEVLR
ncbi:MAG: pyruvate, phosphate dikinase, partial [Planctomycetes bacterium]|nr:pyruvate, phosphate dikinase [Planctomycetota bacterium]